MTPTSNMHKTRKLLTKLGCLLTTACLTSLARRLFSLMIMDCQVILST